LLVGGEFLETRLIDFERDSTAKAAVLNLGRFGLQHRRMEMFSGGEVAGKRTSRRGRSNAVQLRIAMELGTHKTANANVSKFLTFVLIESSAVTGPCTAEYEPVRAGKKKIEAIQRIARIANSKANWREAINSLPQGISAKGPYFLRSKYAAGRLAGLLNSMQEILGQDVTAWLQSTHIVLVRKTSRKQPRTRYIAKRYNER
jgi:hypothetical protein